MPFMGDPTPQPEFINTTPSAGEPEADVVSTLMGRVANFILEHRSVIPVTINLEYENRGGKEVMHLTNTSRLSGLDHHLPRTLEGQQKRWILEVKPDGANWYYSINPYSS